MTNPEYTSPNEGDDFVYAIDLNIDAVRALHSHLNYSLEMWPGAPRRPVEEQEFLRYLKATMFTIMIEHSYAGKDADKN